MKKIVSIIVAVVLLCGIYYAYNHLYKFKINEEAIQLYDVTLLSDSTSFGITLTHSGYFIKEYKYKIYDNIMYVEFYGTMFEKCRLDNMNIIVPEGGISKVIVSDSIK